MMIDEGSSGSGQGSGNTGGMGVGVGGGMKWAAGVTTALTTRYPTQKNTGKTNVNMYVYVSYVYMHTTGV